MLFLSRLLLVLTAALLACLLAACDYVRPFEQVCEARLGPGSVAVEAAPVRYETDFGQSSAQLTSRGAHAAGHIVLGLTETQLKGKVSFDGNGVVKPLSGRYCVRPVVSVKLAFDPMVLLVAREQKEGGCEHRITLDHETRHMRVYAAYLDELAAQVEQDLKKQFGDRILYYPSTAVAEMQMNALAAESLKPYLDRGMAQVQERQKKVDSPEEYARMDSLQARCGG